MVHRAGLLPGAVLLAITLAGCHDSAVPPGPRAPGPPDRLEVGPQPALRGLGTLGTGPAAPGGNRQDFDFDVGADLTGRLFYRDWRFDASITVDGDPQTRITAFRERSGFCGDPASGAEFEAVGRRSDGAYEAFLVVGCDNGAAGSGTDFFGIQTASQYLNTGTLSGGDIVKVVTGASPATGTLTIVTATTGQDLPTGYAFSASGPGGSVTEQSIGANDTRAFPNIAPGDYSVSLAGVPANCALSGVNPRTVTVPPGGTGSTTFSITCSATAPGTGDLRVTTGTTGSSLDPDGYTVTLDGSARRSIGINASTTFTGLAAGTHTAVLTGVASNCTVSGGATRTGNVPAGGTATVSYSVSCVTPNTTPTANAGPDETVLLGVLYKLTWWFGDPDHGPWSYTIHWGDGSSTSGTASSPGTYQTSHTYLLIGSYTIRVTVRDSQAASGSDAKVLTVFTDVGGILP
ncbi:MAG TPA: PKD domain-containing protein [Gemmatimonadales bacterium]|nr:PKD domain-containing protein [Gemmatimonadales bacterium]